MATTPHADRHNADSSSAFRDDFDNRSTAPNTVIVSDVRLYRDGLALGLERRGDIRLVGSVSSGDAAEPLLAASVEPMLVLLDAGMPHAVDVARRLLSVAPLTKIVAIAVADDAADIVACAEAGMDGYVPRDGSIADVGDAIRSAMQGELRCSPRMAAALFKRLAAPGQSAIAPPPRLTARELEIVGLIDRGLSNKQIAQRLRIGTPTVKNHVHKILEKLNVTRRAEAAARVRGQQATTSVSGRRRSANSGEMDQTI